MNILIMQCRLLSLQFAEKALSFFVASGCPNSSLKNAL